MSSRNVFASTVTACLLAIGLGGVAPAANAASAGQSFLNLGESARTDVIEIKRRGHGHDHGPRIIIRPIAPSYLYYDYPYYYSRGYYPRHIGPGLIYPYPAYYEGDESDADDAAVPYSAKERCDRRFKSFEWDSGLYTTYGGRKKLCPYLR
jgi:BA14K-like protein